MYYLIAKLQRQKDHKPTLPGVRFSKPKVGEGHRKPGQAAVSGRMWSVLYKGPDVYTASAWRATRGISSLGDHTVHLHEYTVHNTVNVAPSAGTSSGVVGSGRREAQGRPAKTSLSTEEAPCSIQEARSEGVHAYHKDPQFHRSSHVPRSRASAAKHPAAESTRWYGIVEFNIPLDTV